MPAPALTSLALELLLNILDFLPVESATYLTSVGNDIDP